MVSVGWTEDEYWEEYRGHPRYCRDCGEPIDKDGNHIDESDLKKDTPPESKSN